MGFPSREQGGIGKNLQQCATEEAGTGSTCKVRQARSSAPTPLTLYAHVSAAEGYRRDREARQKSFGGVLGHLRVPLPDRSIGIFSNPTLALFEPLGFPITVDLGIALLFSLEHGLLAKKLEIVACD